MPAESFVPQQIFPNYFLVHFVIFIRIFPLCHLMRWSEGYHNFYPVPPPLFGVVIFDPRFLVGLV